MGIIKRATNRVGSAVATGLALDIFVEAFKGMKAIFYRVFMPWKVETPGVSETFEQAIKRMGINEYELEERKKMYAVQVIMYMVVGIGVLIYAVLLARAGQIVGMFVALIVGVLAFAYAFRSHFWLFQLKQRRLGCTFQEWLSSSIQG